MSQTDLASKWHELFISSAMLAGILYFIIINYRKPVFLINIMLLITGASLVYIASDFMLKNYLMNLSPQINDFFPYLSQSLSLFITFGGIYLSKSIFRLSEALLISCGSILIILLTISFTGHLMNALILIPEETLIASINIFPEGKQNQLQLANIFYYVGTILTYLSLLIISRKIKYAFSIVSITIFIFLGSNFILLFFIPSNNLAILSVKIIGINTIQWGILLFNSLLGLFVLAIERKPGYKKINFKPRYFSIKVLIPIYMLISIMSLKISGIFTSLNEIMFLAIFLATTGILILMLIERIQIPYFKTGIAGILILLGVFFIQAKFINKDAEKQIDEYNSANFPVPTMQTIYVNPVRKMEFNNEGLIELAP